MGHNSAAKEHRYDSWKGRPLAEDVAEKPWKYSQSHFRNALFLHQKSHVLHEYCNQNADCHSDGDGTDKHLNKSEHQEPNVLSPDIEIGCKLVVSHIVANRFEEGDSESIFVEGLSKDDRKEFGVSLFVDDFLSHHWFDGAQSRSHHESLPVQKSDRFLSIRDWDEKTCYITTSTWNVENVKQTPSDEKIENSAQNAVQIDKSEILEKLPSGEVISVFEHDWRQQYQHDHISDRVLGSILVFLKVVGVVKGEQPCEQSDDDGDGCLLEIVELNVRGGTLLCAKNWVMMKKKMMKIKSTVSMR